MSSPPSQDRVVEAAPEERVRLVPDLASLKKAAIASTPLVVLGLLALIDLPICPTRLGIGVPCPGCGLTRATIAAMHLDLAGVLRYHPLAPILTPVVAWSFAKPVLLALGWIKQSWVDRLPSAPQILWVVLGLAMAVLWVARLMGHLGGHPDPIDLTQGYIYRGGHGLWHLITGS